MRYGRRFWLLGMLILLLGVARPPGSAVAQSADIQLAVQPFFSGKYRAGSWLPLRITVANSGSDVDAVISVQAGATYEMPLELPRGANKSVVLYVQPATFRRGVTARVMVGGSEVQKADVPLSWFPTQTDVIGLITGQPLAMPLPAGNNQQKIETIAINPADVPDRSEGLTMFDALIVDGAPLVDLSPAQQQALADWVRTDGQLVVGGEQLDATLQQLPEALRVAQIGDVAPPGSISLLPELAANAPATTLIPTRGSHTIATTNGVAVGVQQEFGTGRVTILGWSLSAPELRELPPDAAIWSEIVRLRLNMPEMIKMQPVSDMLAQQLGGALTTLPVLAMPPMRVLVALLAVYLLIVGPGLYLLLRRLDRQAWGWVAIPLITLVFSLGAYGYGLRLRGDDVILNQLSVLEPLAGRTHVRTFGGLFSPRTQTYNISSTSDALFKPLATGDFGVPAAPSNGRFVQGSSGVNDLQVAQWSMNTFAAEQMIDGVPLEADLTLAGGQLRASVRNAGSLPIRDVALIQNTRIAKIGDLRPGESKPVELNLDKPLGTLDGSVSMMILRDQWNFQQPMQPPADIRMRMMVLDALFNMPYGRPTEPVVVGWIDQAPIALQVDQSRVQRQQLSLISLRVPVAYDAGERISLPLGWLTPTIETSSQNGGPCMTQVGNGWYSDMGVVTTTLQLPPALQAMEVDDAALHWRIEGPPPPEKLRFEVYDWTTGAWITQDASSNDLALEQPARFFSPTGHFKVRIDWGNSGMQGKGGGCMTTDLSVEGRQS